MRIRKGFTLAELVLSVFIFSFIAASLATIVSTTNRHMFQNYRSNIVKTNVLITMKAIQNNLSVATRVDLPKPNAAGQILAFALNVDQNQNQTSGCYPIIASAPASWHYFCMANGNIYYHRGVINTAGATPCGSPAPSMWADGGYLVPGGCAGGTLMMQSVVPALPGGALFSRRTSDGVNEMDTVRVLLRSNWIAASPAAAGANFRSSQRDVDSSLDTVIRFNRSQ